ncbi:MAG: dipeptidase [Sphingopyxis sp.]|jgi:membrane dipeptidase|nr:dipeptidase [Sphingopyxis sp.]
MKLLAAPFALALTLTACSPSPAPEAAAGGADPAAIHARTLTLDTHLDTPVVFARRDWDFAARHDWASDLSHVDLPRMTTNGALDGGFFVIYTPQGEIGAADDAAALAHARARLAVTQRTFAANSRAIGLALTADDALRIDRSGRRVAFLAMENSSPLGTDLSLLEEFYRAGVRMAGPVHNRGNRLADSAGGPVRHGGLSELGRQWVREMNRLGIIIDGSHSSDDTLRQMMALSTTPVILSHSGFKAIFDHRRNIDDTLAREVAAQGGVIHINSVFLSRYNSTPARDALSDRMEQMDRMPVAEQRALAAEWAALDRTERVNEGDFALYMRALLHCLRVVGVDHCGIGADWDGGGGLSDMEDIEANPRITAALIAAGYSAADVEKIWSGNILRVLRAVEAARTR